MNLTMQPRRAESLPLSISFNDLSLAMQEKIVRLLESNYNDDGIYSRVNGIKAEIIL